MIRLLSMICGGVLLCGCSNASGQVNREAKKTADTLTGDDKLSAAQNRRCQLFTVAEIGKYIGKPVTAGQNAAGGSGCAWDVKGVKDDEDGQALIQIIPAEYHDWGRGDKQLPEVGTKGFVRKGFFSADDWKAVALKGDESILVLLSGSASSENAAIELLKETLKRWTK